MNKWKNGLLTGAAVGIVVVFLAHPTSSIAQNSPPAPVFASDEYLLLGDATRGAGEPMIAVDPTNPKNIIAVAMGNLQRLGVEPAMKNMTDDYHAAANSTITWLAVTHDGGIRWKVGELPILEGKFTRCPDSFAHVTADGTFLAWCEPRETSGEFYGESAVVVSRDKGETWSKPASLISSYGIKRFAPGLKPRIGGNAPWDRPFLFIDDSMGIIFGQAGGGETDIDQQPGKYRTQGYLTASTDKGKSFGTIYAWDSPDYPQLGRGHMTAGHGVVAVSYIARSAPASEQATCPCAVMGLSRDQGKTFAYHVLKNIVVPPQSAVGRRGGGGPGGPIGELLADPTTAGRFALMTLRNMQYQVSISNDFGKTWSDFTPAGETPDAVTLTKSWLSYSPKGVLGLVWRAIYQDRTYDIWSSVSLDGGRTFSAPLRVSHAVSPGANPYRTAGLFGDDIQNLVMDDQNVHMVWGDSRAGFQAVWYGRVPLSAYAAPGSAGLR
jgi:hypothetical protein